jgi:hypothetical protein
MNKTDMRNLYKKICTINDNKNILEINKLVEFIKCEGIQYSVNSNGLFFNLSTLDDKTLQKLEGYLSTTHKIPNHKDIIYNLNTDYNQFIGSIPPKVYNITYKKFNLSPLETKILAFSK